MTRYADIPKPIRSGIVVVDPERGTPQRIIVLQFNPDTLERSLAPQSAGGSGDAGGGGSGGDRNEALRLKGPAEETWKFTAEIDATDQFEVAAPDGIHPQLAMLEMLVQPTSAQLREASRLTQKGTIEISPIEMPLTLFTWGSKRVMPVRLTELSINESAFDVESQPDQGEPRHRHEGAQRERSARRAPRGRPVSRTSGAEGTARRRRARRSAGRARSGTGAVRRD